MFFSLKDDITVEYLYCISDRYVTVNINGDVCISDEKLQGIRLYSSSLEPLMVIRNPYTDHPESREPFSPMGITHDSFGRLIVADHRNHCVVRITVDVSSLSYKSEVIVRNGEEGVQDLDFPTLVAMGPGPHLWVVCKNNIQVFSYMDKE